MAQSIDFFRGISANDIIKYDFENASTSLVLELGFYEISLKLCELELESLMKNHPYNEEIQWQSRHFQSLVLFEKRNIKKVKRHAQRLSLLKENFKLPDNWKQSRHYRVVARELEMVRNDVNELLSEVDQQKHHWT